MTSASSTFVIDAYHQLWHIEKSFRMYKHDLQARPIYRHLRDSIEAHLSIVPAAMAVSHHIEVQTGWSIKKFVRTARRYRTVKIQAGNQSSPPKFVHVLLDNGLRDSMGRAGACGDNAAMESFFALLQRNVLDRQRWATRTELRLAIVTWIERTFHRRRRQRALGKLTP